MSRLNTKRLLVTGGAIGDIPVIKVASEMGFQVFTSGNRSNDPGHHFAHTYVDVDYTNEDELSRIVHDFNIDFIIPSCHDIAYISAARVAKIFDLPGFDAPHLAMQIHSKDKLAKAITDSGLDGIETRIFTNLKDAQDFFIHQKRKIAVKPTDMTGGRGVSFVSDFNCLPEAIERAKTESINGTVLLQEVIQGSEHGFTAMIVNNRVVFSFFDDEYRFLNRYRVAGTAFPSSVDQQSKLYLIDWLNSFSSYLGLVDGLIHLQFIQSTLGPKVLEICRRPPGDLYPYFVETSTSYKYTQNIINGFLGLPISPFPELNISGLATIRHVVTASSNGIFLGLEISPTIRHSILNTYEFKKPGDSVDHYLTETIAIVILQIRVDNRIELLEILPEIIKPKMESFAS